MDPDVSVEMVSIGDISAYAIKLSSPHYEVNVYVPTHEITKLSQVMTTPWLDGSLKIGESAGSPVFWSVDDGGEVSILIGHDDETWDIAIPITVTSFEAILREVEACSGGRGGA